MKIRHNRTVKEKRKLRVRGRFSGTAKRPRLSVHRTNMHVYTQIIDDDKSVTILGVNDSHLDSKKKMTKTEKAKAVGLLLADKLKKAKIKAVVFDRGSFRYHGRIKMIAEVLREQGIQL